MSDIYYHDLSTGVFEKVLTFVITSGKLVSARTQRTPATNVTAATGDQLVKMNTNPINGIATWTVIAVK